MIEKQKQTKKELEKLKKKPEKNVKSEIPTAKVASAYANYTQAAKQFLYRPFVLLPDLTDVIGKTIEVRIHKSYLTKFNKAVQYQMFYGNDFYSSDSDVVCILQHQGVYNLTDREPHDFEGIAAIFKVSKGRNNYPNQYKNGIKSQKKKVHYEGNSIKYDNYCYYLTKQDFEDETKLKAMAEVMPNKIDNKLSLKKIIKQNQKAKIKISKLADTAKKAVWPTLIFNLSNELAFKFNLCTFGDKSRDYESRTSYLV